jgi:membrane-associated protease RseP (regulator of RpoE activity)
LSLALGTAGLLGSGFSTDGPLSVLQALGVLASIIAFHEAGHFAAARLQGIRVTQFAVGFGPPLFAWKVRVFGCTSALVWCLLGAVVAVAVAVAGVLLCASLTTTHTSTH